MRAASPFGPVAAQLAAPVAAVRGTIAGHVRRALVGRNGAERRRQLFETGEPGWFADDAVIRRVHADSAMFVGGLRALLLQSLHPLAMAGVAQHSDYRADPWGRLQRTADFVAATTFGPAGQAERAVARVRAVHDHVNGFAPDGRAYSANDPHLLAWVHIVEIDSFLAAYRRYGSAPISPADADRYVSDCAVVAEALGVLDPPTSVAVLRSQLAAFRPELAGTPDARRAARFLVLQPPVTLAMRPVYGAIAAAAVELLPRWARAPLRLPSFPVVEAFTVRPAGDAVVRTLRWALADGGRSSA